MGIPFTLPMGFLFTATLAFLFTMTLGFQLTISIPHHSLTTCRPPYPGRTRRTSFSGLPRGGPGLRREVSGSASPL